MRFSARRQPDPGDLRERVAGVWRLARFRLREILSPSGGETGLRLLLALAVTATLGAGGMLLSCPDSGEPSPPEKTGCSRTESGREPIVADSDAHEAPKYGIRTDASAYREDEKAVLADVARQVDAALLQALGRLKLDPSRMKVLDSETRFSRAGQVYPFLRLGLDPGPGTTEKKAVAAIREALRVWAPRARLAEEGGGLYFVVVEGEITHSLACGPHAAGRAASAGPRDAMGRARLVIVIDDVGESLPVVRRLLALPYLVTLSIWPRSTHAAYAATLARERGRQVFLHQPMQPLNAGEGSAGDDALTTDMSVEAMAFRLAGAFRLVPYAEGINNHMGSRFTSDPASVRRFCAVLRETRPDVLVLDSLTHGGSVLYDEAREQGFAAFRRALFLDDVRGKASILNELNHGLTLARKHGQAVVIGHPRPDTLAALAAWQGYRQADVSIGPLARPDNTNGGSAAPATEIP